MIDNGMNHEQINAEKSAAHCGPKACRISLSALARYAGLYVLLVAYSVLYEWFYKHELTPLYHDLFTQYDPLRSEIYAAVALLTPIAILPIGTTLRTAGQFIVGILAILVFIPIPIVFVPLASVDEYWRIYWILWISYFLVCALSSIDLRVSVAQLNPKAYNRVLLAVFLAIGCGLLYVLATNRVDLVALSKAHAARVGITVSGFEGYLIPSYFNSFGGLLIAFAIVQRRYYLLLFAMLGFVACYATIEQRTAIVMPFWIAYIVLAQKIVFQKSLPRYLFCIMVPFLILVAAASVIGTSNHKSIFYYLFALATYRMYSVPAIAFNVYHNFFYFNPHTHWTHIGIVAKFLESPYGRSSIPHMLLETYHLGSYNASYIETDGLAAAGVSAIPWISFAFGVMLIAINSCMRKIDITVLATITAGASFAFVDTGIGPGLLTNGLAALSVVMLFAPRQRPWAEVN